MLKHLFSKFYLGVFLLSTLTFTACEPASTKDDPAPAEEPAPTEEPTPIENPAARTVTGIVVDAQGKPLAGAKVRIENDFFYYDITTTAQGKYTSPSLPAGGFKALAWATISYKGQNYTLRMGMPQSSDYDYIDPKNGIVRNFKLQISGRIPDRDGEYFGGTLEFMNGTGSIFDERMNPGDQVYITLNPTGPLLDGTIGKKIEKSFTIRSGNDSYLLADIPTGEYELSAVRVTPEGHQEQVLVGTFSKQWEAALINFQPGSYGVGTYASGLARLSLYLNLKR